MAELADALVSGNVTSVASLLHSVQFFEGPKMNFNVETAYTKERLLKFNTFVFMRRKIVWIACLIIAVLISIPFFVSLANGEFNKKYFLYFILVSCWTALYFLYRLLFPLLAINKNPLLNAVVKYEFHDSHFTISSPSNSFSESPEISYDLISKVFFYKNDLYIYFSNSRLFILDTQSFEADTKNSFLDFLKERKVNIFK